MQRRRVAVVPHTHWDREWYEPFQTFRMRLVELMDGLLDLLDADPSYSKFLLDGQMAVVDDYLEVRPENEDRLRRHAASGRLSMGPWYILMDEFLVSGETLIRDLQLGIRRGAAFGGVAEVGYLPDMFGHVAQMPQLLRLAGFEHAVVWRGVPSQITKSGFRWQAPDGSEVRAEYLLSGYGSAAALPDDATAVVARTKDHEAAYATFINGDILFMNGSDHLMPQPWLGRVLAEANGIQDEYDYEISTLKEYLDRAPTENLELWTGELRSGFRANVLMGVASNRVDVKRASALAERSLERRAEPLSALFVDPKKWPRSLFEIAWKEMIRNAAHDSICACSVDSVVDAVLYRFMQAQQIGDGIADRALRTLGTSMRNGGYVVANPSAGARGGLVELVVVADEVQADRVQVISERTNLPGELVLDAQTARTLLPIFDGPKLDEHAWVEEVEVDEVDGEIVLTVKIGPFERPDVKLEQVRDALAGKLAANPDAVVRIRLDQPPIRRVLARSNIVPGFGWRRFEAAPLDHPVAVSDDGTISNGLVSVTADPATGTFTIDGHPGFGRLVDEGDLGDSYNYSPPGGDRRIDVPTSVEVMVAERGPVRARLVIDSTYELATHIDGVTQQRVGAVDVNVSTVVDVLADESAVRVRTSFVNPARDHRLRVHFPTVAPATHSIAECAFGTVTRELTAEGRSDEFGLPTFPSRRFVQAGRLTVIHSGLTEYELTAVKDGVSQELAITLLRSTGMLSRLGMALRPLPAGPLTPVDGLQMVGRIVDASYALAIDAENPWNLCDDVLDPLEVTTADGGGTREDEGSELTITGAVVSSLQVVDGLTELRVFNPLDTANEVVVSGRRGWEIDLRGQTISAFEGSLHLRARGIATLRLAPSGH